jgi:thioredoxin reductase (NADPH)
VTIVHRRDELRAGPILEKRAKENPKVKFIWDSVIDEIKGNGSVESVALRNLKSGEESIHPIDGVFIFIGHTPNTNLFQEQIEMDERGYIVVDNYMQTSVPGVYAAGEAADSHFRQVITSAGMGAAAAIQAGHFLDEQEAIA